MIRLASSADATCRFAAEQLAYYIALVTGGRPSVVETSAQRSETTPAGPAIELRLQERTGDRCRDETASLRVADCLGVLTARSPAGLLFGTYHIIENFAGVCWLNRWEREEYVPRAEKLIVPDGEYSWSPRFSCRAFTNYPRIDAETTDFVDWMAKQGFNQYVINPQFPGALDAYRTFLRGALALRGMKASLEHHTLPFWLTPGEYFHEHPEYFALVGGQRRPDGQVCTSHPEVREIITRRILEFLDEYPEIMEIGLWPRDGFGWCECEVCIAGQPQVSSSLWPDLRCRTDTYLDFVNDVAERVTQERPDVSITALAYLNYAEPPQSVRPLSNLVIYFAPILRCFKHQINDTGCRRRNPTYADMLLRWRDATPGQLRLFLYDMGIDTLSLPYPCAERIAADFDFYERAGVDGYVLEYVPEEWVTFGANARAVAFASWKGGTGAANQLATHMERYWKALYGPSASAMTDYWRELAVRLVEEGPCTGHYDLSWTRRATPGLLSSALVSLGQALAAAAPEKAAWQALRRVQVSCEHLLRVGEWQRHLAEAQCCTGQAIARAAELAAAAAEAVVAWARANESFGAVHAEKVADRVWREMQALGGICSGNSV
ncbi:MAG: DUF4838 domain-containing protein [Armatimonadetes bacterium]|nr:DUF4838 domain-containing protein [Armatimonadota bacterium]